MSKIKSVIASFGVLLMVAMGIGATATPANAYLTPGARITTFSGNVKVDNWVVFQKQNDGTGVRLTDVWLGVAAGCGSHFTQTPKWWTTIVNVYDGNTGAYVTGYTEGNWNACDRTIAQGKSGLDTGFIKVVIMSGARHPGGGDLWYEWVWHLYPSGNSVLVYSGTTNY